MGILDRLFGKKGARDTPTDGELERLVQRVLELSPRLRLARGHEARLRAAIAKAVDHLRDLVEGFPQPWPLAPAAWATDDSIRAFFAAADDVELTLGRAAELVEFFAQQPACHEAYAVLGMTLSERRTLGVARKGDVMRSDVAQTTVSFSDHQIRICAASDQQLRRDIVYRMVEQLAIEGLARNAAAGTRRDALEQERALLATRVRLLERRGTGMRSMVGDEPVDSAEMNRVRAQLEENDAELKRIGSRTDALERQLEGMCGVFVQAARRILVKPKRLHVSRMNVVLGAHGAYDEEDLEEGHLLDLKSTLVPGDPPRERVFALVRVARLDVPSPRNMLHDAERLL
jgi:hypothetical protein